MKKFIILILGVFFLMPLSLLATGIDNVSLGSVNSINLSGSGDKITWSVDGYSSKGFKVAWSKNSGPTYPTREGDKYHYHSSPNQSEDTLNAFDGDGTYYVRVCEYLGGKCGVYSNEIKVVLGDSGDSGSIDDSSGDVQSITLSVDGTKVTWSVDGYSSKGFKVVWSKNSGPIYPTREGDKYHYFSDPSYYYDNNLTAFKGAGTYYVRVCEYLGGECGVYSNEVSVNLESEKDKIACTMDYRPVCGRDGKTYSNKCMLDAHGVEKSYEGECKKDEDIISIEDNTQKLLNNQIGDILKELKLLRDMVKEQKAEIKYLRNMLSDMSKLTEAMQDSINQFIAYGVDENTKMLGEGERAAVIHSYKAAFGKLPSTEYELSDAIKIANGRWPSITSEEAEASARANFRFIYKRDADMNNPQDNAAITIMAYGLRQKARNRNLDSERRGIQIFEAIYDRLPTTTEDWNIMQAITYSGASR